MLFKQCNVIIHCREEGCIGNRPPEAIYTLRRKSRGPRISVSEGCKLPRGRTFQFIPTRGSVFPFFFQKQECIGNYVPNSRVVLILCNFNALLLYKKEWPIPTPHLKSIFDLRYTATFLIVAVKSCFIACDNNSNAVSFL